MCILPAGAGKVRGFLAFCEIYRLPATPVGGDKWWPGRERL